MKDEQSLISAWVDGEIESPWKEKIAQRIAEDPEWKAEADRLTAVRAALQDLPQPELEAAKARVRDRLSHRLAVIEPKQPVYRHKLTFSLPGVAAAALVLVLGGLYLGFSFSTGAAAVNPVVASKADTEDVIQAQLPKKFNLQVNGEGRLLQMSNYVGPDQ